MKKDYTIAEVWYHDLWSDGELWTSNDRQILGRVTIPTDYTGSDVVKALRGHGYLPKRKHYTADDQCDGAVYVESVKGDEMIEVITEPNDFANVLEALQAAGFEQESAEIEKVADLNVTLEADKARKVLKIIDKLEELDDVQLVSTNLELPDDFEDSEED